MTKHAELTRKYELMVIVDAALAKEEKDKLFKQATESVTKNNVKLVNAQVWLEKHKFPFFIKKRAEGTYYLINFEGKSDVIAPIREALRLNENILRCAITQVEEFAVAVAVA